MPGTAWPSIWNAEEEAARAALASLSPKTREFFLLGLADARSRAKKGGRLSAALGRVASALGADLPKADSEELSRRLRSLEPRAMSEFRGISFLESVPANPPSLAGLTEIDYRNLDRVFDEILPRQFASERGSEDYSAFSRPAQKAMARKVAETLGSGRFLLLDAPTGTGKTLAYLVPALLWAARCETRVGISTYTRTLQEQAFDRELPRAVRALEEIGLAGTLRTSLMKGRQNYLCWGRLQSLEPGPEDSAEDFLAWLLVALFSLSDSTGDFDRFEPGLPESFPGFEKISARLARLRREASSRRRCCRSDEKRGCGAEIAKKRAERSHLVIANHAFVFAFPDLFFHVVFDEAEHLHAQALSSESVEFRPSALARRLDELCREEAGSRAPLDLLRRGGDLLAAEWGPRVPDAVEAWRKTLAALERIRSEFAAFESWRAIEATRRDPKLAHSLLRFYGEDPMGEGLYQAREDLANAGAELLKALEHLIEDLLTAPMKGAERLRLQIDRLREELAEVFESFALCLPAAEGRIRFDNAFFYDLERNASRPDEPLLARRVLLPHLWLAERFWPRLQSAALLSATAHLHGGFEATAGYLGLEGGGHGTSPCPPRLVTFKAPDPFDYSRVLFAVPTDAPRFDAGRGGREAFLAFAADFVRDLCARTRGRCLVLFTSADDLRNAARRLAPFFESERLPFWYQGMEGIPKEQLADRFRKNPGSVLFGLDTFWYGVDFPGGICEFVVLVKLPYGQLDRYLFAQRDALGDEEHRSRIYLPRALAMFRQGFGRLLRSKDDRGVVFLLDRRVLESRNRLFFRELPGMNGEPDLEPALQTLFAPKRLCLEKALAHIARFGSDRDILPDVVPRQSSQGGAM